MKIELPVYKSKLQTSRDNSKKYLKCEHCSNGSAPTEIQKIHNRNWIRAWLNINFGENLEFELI